MSRQKLIFPRSLVLILSLSPLVAAFQKSECNAKVESLLANGTLSPNDWIFHRENGIPMSSPSNLILNLPGCVSTCGAGSSFYEDVGPRLSTWLIPILLLIGNMHISRLGKEKYLALLHFIGDPIDTIWSLLTKAESWSRCYSYAQRTVSITHYEEPEHHHQRILDVATIYAAIEELDSSGTDRFHVFFDQIVAAKREDMTMDHFYHICKEVANELSDSRSVELRRAGLAVFAYFYHVTSGFVEALGGESSSPPGGRIGTSMFISWLIPAVLVSNALGGFTSRRTCLRILERFVKTVTGNSVEDRQIFSVDKYSSMLGDKSTVTDFYSAQQWAGAVYCYRPQKVLFRGGERDNSAFLLMLLAVLPVALSSATSVALIWVTPTTGFGCRSLMMVSIFGLWVVSAFITWASWAFGLVNGVYHYRLTLIKDGFIGVPVFLVIILSSCGIFNSCFCWSAFFSRKYGAYVVLDDSDERGLNAHTYYPGLVAACLCLQMVLFGWMLRVVRNGSMLFRRDEERKQEDWLETHVRRGHIRSPTFLGVPNKVVVPGLVLPVQGVKARLLGDSS